MKVASIIITRFGTIAILADGSKLFVPDNIVIQGVSAMRRMFPGSKIIDLKDQNEHA